MNTTEFIINKSQYETYNTGCNTEIQKCIASCNDFHANVQTTLHDRFVVGLIFLGVIIFYQLYIKYHKPNYSQLPFYIKHIDYRIDYIIIIMTVALIGLLFF